MRRRHLATDLTLSTTASYLATKAMEPVSMKLYEWESAANRAGEDAARPGPPYRIAAEKTARLVGLELSEAAMGKAALAFHYGLAASWAPLYPLLRRRANLGPLAAGPGHRASMSFLVDETLTPALGFSAPNRSYPLATHARGLVAHLVFGLAVATVTEVGWVVLRRRP
jgi:hypothetical protein